MHGCGNIIKRSRGKEQTHTWHIIKCDVTFTHYRPVLTSKGGFTLSDFSEVAFPLSSVILLHFTFLISRPCLQQGWQVRVLLLWTLLLRQATLLLCPGSGEPRHISQHFPWHQWGGFCCWLQHNSNKGRMRAIFKHWLFDHFMHSIIVSFKYPGIYLRRRGEFSQKDFGQDSNRFLSRDPTLSSWPDLLASPLGLGSGCFR